MKCNKQPPFFKHLPIYIEIANVWDVSLDSELWVRVKKLALSMNKSYSSITRYCVLRLVRYSSIRMRPAMEKHSQKVKTAHRVTHTKHRHQLCLYGDDEQLLRLAAMQLRITVSHLIRLCLYWHLPKLEAYQVFRSVTHQKNTEALFNPERYCSIKRFCRDRLYEYTRQKYIIPMSDRIFFFASIKWTKQLSWDHWQTKVGRKTTLKQETYEPDDWFSVPA